MGGELSKVDSRGSIRFAHMCHIASLSGSGAMSPEGAAPVPESDLRVRGQVESGDAACRATENLQTAGGRDVTPPGRLGVSLTQPGATSATSSATASMPVGAEGGGSGYKRQTRPISRMWEGMTSGRYWKRGRHEPGANNSTRGQRVAPGPWPEARARWREQTVGEDEGPWEEV